MGQPGYGFASAAFGSIHRGQKSATEGTQIAKGPSLNPSMPYWTVMPRCWSPVM